MRCHVAGCKKTNLWRACARSACSSATGSCTGTWCETHGCAAEPIQRSRGRQSGKRKRKPEHPGEGAEEVAGAASSASIPLRRSRLETQLGHQVDRLSKRLQSFEDDAQSATAELERLRAELEREKKERAEAEEKLERENKKRKEADRNLEHEKRGHEPQSVSATKPAISLPPSS